MATEPLHMDRTDPYRPRISRETRLLLTTALIATVALWVLARVRFPDRPPPTNPVQPLLTQLTPRPTFADLAAEIAVLRPRLVPLLVAVEPDRPGLRVTDDTAVVWLNPKQQLAEQDADSLAGYDPVSGLALVRVESRATPPAVLWSPQSLGPRYFVASEMSSAGISLRPAYVAALGPTDSPRWPGQEWQVPSGANLAPGSFLFTAEAEIAGLVIDHGDGHALVPAETLFAEAARLSGQPRAARGYIGIDVQPLTPALSKATGATSGVVVAWVDPRGPGTDGLNVGDVIVSGNRTGVPTPDHWEALIARLTTGETLTMSVRGASGARDVSLMVAAPRAADPASLGLALRSVPGVGVEVVRIEPGSSGDRSGLVAGDVITRVDTTDVPTPAELRQAFTASRDRALIVGFTRGTSRRVTALEK
jgi:S1-C subfamily serine protease